MPQVTDHADRVLASQRRRPTRSLLAATLMILATAFVPDLALAQRSGNGFLFGPPPATLTLRGGLAVADAASDIFEFVTDELTLGRRDFSGPSFGLELGARVHPRLDFALAAGYSGSRAGSEFRDWIDQDDQPIEQTTSFRRIPVTASLKAYLLPRGRQISRYAWIPARWSPYIGVGGGFLHYKFSQRGDFIDFETLEVFEDDFTSSGWTPTVHALVGFDFSLSPRVALTFENRYSRANAMLSRSFEGFDRIDLSGHSSTVGIMIRSR